MPEGLAFAEAERLIGEGRTVFFASDDPAVEARFREKLGPGLISFPKGRALPVRWPRPIHAEGEIFRDLVDLFLLARCEFVIGAEASSFCRMAMVCNGSPLCRYLDEEKAAMAKGVRGPLPQERRRPSGPPESAAQGRVFFSTPSVPVAELPKSVRPSSAGADLGGVFPADSIQVGSGPSALGAFAGKRKDPESDAAAVGDDEAAAGDDRDGSQQAPPELQPSQAATSPRPAYE